MTNSILITDPRLASFFQGMTGTTGNAYQNEPMALDFLKVVNASPLFAQQLNDYLLQQGAILTESILHLAGKNGKTFPAAGQTDPLGGPITIGINNLNGDPNFTSTGVGSAGFRLAETVAHELGPIRQSRLQGSARRVRHHQFDGMRSINHVLDLQALT